MTDAQWLSLTVLLCCVILLAVVAGIGLARYITSGRWADHARRSARRVNDRANGRICRGCGKRGLPTGSYECDNEECRSLSEHAMGW